MLMPSTRPQISTSLFWPGQVIHFWEKEALMMQRAGYSMALSLSDEVRLPRET